YARSLAEVTAEVAARAGGESHPLLQQRDPRRVVMVVVTSDRGLCGGFNSNVCRAAQRWGNDKIHNKEADEVTYLVVGRKGRDFFRRRKLPMKGDLPGPTGDTAVQRAKDLAATLTDDFLSSVDSVVLVYNQFRSIVSQKITIEPLLPVAPSATGRGGQDFLYEPSKNEILDWILPLYVEMQIHAALLESIASEFGARRTAMENATKNATEMIDRLTLQYNRARQAAITKELMEIVGGAEALKG
ncbi:MAG TPA: ATP synthase F1 subunit gamma, partial [Polyangia bacterium]|nr:ATP synthase F1 subunit gamma [Polyangia bacterium]